MRLIGRERELSALRQALAANRLVTVWGPAGVGKTRLVREAVDPPARFCALAGVETRSDLGRAILSSFQLDSASIGEHDVPRVLARATGTLVLDGADAIASCLGAELAGWLSAAPEARIVVTALSPLGLESEMELELSALTLDAALELYAEALGERGGRAPDPDIARQIVELLECLPHALESFAPLAALSTDASSLERLKRATADFPLDRAFSSVISALDPVELDTLRLLSVFETGVSPAIAERVLGEDLSRIEPLLRRSLVRIDQGRIRVYRSAAQVARPPSESEARSHAAAVLETLSGLDLERMSSRLELGAERQELLAIATRFADTDAALATRALLLLVPLSLDDGSASELLDRLTRLAAKPQPDLELLATTHLALAKLHRRLGQLDESRKCVERALAPGTPTRFEALLERAHIERMQSLAPQAFAGYELALNEARSEGDGRRELVALGELGRMLQSVGRFREAQEHHVRAITLARAHGLPQREALERSLHARATHRAGNVKEAVPLHEQALALHRAHAEHRLAAAELGHLGFCHHEALELATAERYFRESIAGLCDSNDLVLENIERLLLSRLLADTVRFAEARLELALSERSSRDVAMPRLDATRRLVTGLVELGEGRIEEARRELSAALDTGNPIEVGFEGLLHAYLALAEALTDQPEKAQKHLTEGALLVARLEHPGLTAAHAVLASVVRGEPLPEIPHSILASSSDARRALLYAERFGKTTALEVAVDGRELWLPDGTHIELKRSGAPRRLLLCLVEARIHKPGTALGTEELVAAGWPGERMHTVAADKRLRTAIWTLRRSGLSELLQTRDEGYLLDPRTSIRIRHA